MARETSSVRLEGDGESVLGVRGPTLPGFNMPSGDPAHLRAMVAETAFSPTADLQLKQAITLIISHHVRDKDPL